tara:strand:+ start:373 stop:669 length:297 start_codon:yes stop_codon:yes gene_type:complete
VDVQVLEAHLAQDQVEGLSEVHKQAQQEVHQDPGLVAAHRGLVQLEGQIVGLLEQGLQEDLPEVHPAAQQARAQFVAQTQEVPPEVDLLHAALLKERK